MRILARVLWALALLWVLAAFAAFILACWAHGTDAARWTGTGFVTLLGAVAAFGGGWAAEIQG